jgi:hypothetical protein
MLMSLYPCAVLCCTVLITERELTAGDVVPVMVVRQGGHGDERVYIEVCAAHPWVMLADIRAWRATAGLHVSQRPLIDISLANYILKLLVPRLAAKIADVTPTTTPTTAIATTATTADHGVIVTGIEQGGAADRAGLLTHDIIVSIDGDDVTNSNDITSLLQRHNIIAGDVIPIIIRRRNTIPLLTLSLIVAASSPQPIPLGDDGEPIEDLSDDSDMRVAAYRIANLWRSDADYRRFVQSLRVIAHRRVTYL